MGEPVRIIELIRRFAALSGVDLPELHFTGLRIGEKLHEELFDAAETRTATQHSRIWSVQAKQAPKGNFRERIDGLYRLMVEGRVDELLRELNGLLPVDAEYPTENSPQVRAPSPLQSTDYKRQPNIALAGPPMHYTEMAR